MNSAELDQLVAQIGEEILARVNRPALSRAEGLNISRRLSWERTATDFVWQLPSPSNPRHLALASCRNLVTRFGVDGAIHRAAGPALLEECRLLKGCPTGEAKITKGYNLPAKWVIHTVGPIWGEENNREDELLADCYRNSLALVEKHNIKSIAFPSISTGVYGFPKERASRIALREMKNFLDKNSTVEKVIAVCFGHADYERYLTALKDI